MIKVFNATDKNYATHGDLILQPSKAVVHKEDNGEFYLDLETPLNEIEFKNTTPEEGQTAEGTSFSINVDTSKEYEIQTLKGQTTQSGTPTPDSPQPINITTGRQVVSVCGKNLFDKDNITNTLFYDVNDGHIISSSLWSQSQFIAIDTTKKYTLQSSYTTLNNSFEITQFDINQNWIKGQQASMGNGYFVIGTDITLNSNTKYIKIGFRNDRVDTSTMMLEKGNQPTTYEEYKGNDYEINLGKNLLPISDITNITGLTNNGESITLNGTFSSTSWTLTNKIVLQANTTYTLSLNNYLNDQSCTDRVILRNGSTNIIQIYFRGGSVSYTPTQDTIIDTIRFYSNGYSFSDYTFSIQLEKGSVASSFSPYKTPIYLGEIGTYQDYIFKNTTENPLYDSTLEEGQWYIHKEIGRVVLDSSYRRSGGTTGTNAYYIATKVDGLNDNTLALSYSNMFQPCSFNERGNGLDITYLQNGSLTLRTANNTSIDWSDNTKRDAWLDANKPICYYVLNTPTNTLIEDEELINQLNSIELLEGLNNVSVSSLYLPAILKLKYNFTTAYSNIIKYIDYLVPNNILVANTPQGDQAFRITNIEKTRRKIKIRANHVFYDSLNYLIADSYVVDKNCNDALDHLNNATSDLSPFTTISDITNINSFRCVRKSLYEAIKVVLERWGGHLVRNDWTIGIYNEIGQDNGVTIRYAKNLKDISATYDWNDVVTKILPVGKDGILLNDLDDEQPLYIESTVQYDIPYTKSVSFEQNDINEDDYKDEEGNLDEERYKQALIDDLYNQAAAYVSENSVPKVNYNLSANVEKVSDVGDRIEVIDEKLGINLMTRIISFDYDCILEKYTNIEFGNFMPKLSDLMSNITASTEQLIQEQNSTLAITLNRELTDATNKIWNALGNSYVIYDGDKILIVDSLPKETARNVIMLNNGGIGFSNNGINGTFNSAWTIDNVLNMEQINVINLTADLIKGGTLKLGSSLNQNGQLEVYDEANNLLAVLDKNGLRMNGADGSYVIMNNDVGFAGFDRLDNKIYWVDRDEFHQKKSVVEEEITLVNKMRIIPITITDSQNNIVNDGIGFVNVGGGN